MSANRERDLTGYIPLSAGSTILANASMSHSWGVDHLTRDCSDPALELNIIEKNKEVNQSKIKPRGVR